MNLIANGANFILFIVFSIIFFTNSEKITYLSLEHPTVVSYDRNYISYLNATSKRRGRGNPVYYVSLNFEVLVYFGNNISIDFFFYEFLSNQYKPSFVEMRFKFCNLIHKDSFFGPAFKQGKLDRPCPYPPDQYHLSNMTINPSIIPRAFPFQKGRIIINVTVLPNTQVVHGFIDMEIKQLNRKLKTGEKL